MRLACVRVYVCVKEAASIHGAYNFVDFHALTIRPRRCSLSLKCCAARAKYLQCLRGLPIHFFGDSLARNQHQSMQCILDSSPRNRERVNEAGAPGDWHRDQGQTELCVVIPDADLSIQWLATNGFLEFQLLRTVSKREPSRRPSAGGQSRWTDAVSPTG